MNYRFADRVPQFRVSAVRELMAMTQKGDIISFAGGFPLADTFPVDELKAAFDHMFTTGRGSLQYGMTEGYMPLRQLLSERMAKKGIKAPAEQILLTTGSQQAIDLFSKLMLSAGDVVLTENPTFLSALQAFQSYEANVVAVKGDDDGMDPQDLEEKMKQYQPKFVYVVPTFSNPDGKVWSKERRQALLQLAYKYNVLVLEDDPYGEIQFHETETYTPIAALDTAGTHVIYTSTFSKIISPGIRCGWVIAPLTLTKLLAQAKEACDLMSSSPDQDAIYHLLTNFDLDAHIRHISKRYYEHMLVMRDGLQQLDPASYVCREPKGGMFMWVKAPEHVNTTELLKVAVQHGVAFIPGAPFYVDQPQHNTFRLNFTNSTPEKIKLGMERLAQVLQQASK